LSSARDDPEPITAAILLIGAISACGGVGNILYQIRRSRLASQREAARLRRILLRARRTAFSLREDLYSFRSLWRPAFSRAAGKTYVSWGVTSNEFAQLRQIHKRLSRSYQTLHEIQSQLSMLETQPPLDGLHTHTLDAATELLRVLGSVSGPDDVPSLLSQLDSRLDAFYAVLGDYLDQRDMR
jgi:hypothetical protein